MSRSKIILYGHFGSGNIGNDTTLEAALHHVRSYGKQSDLVCVCGGPREIRDRFGIETVPINVDPELQASRSRSRLMRVLPRVRDELGFWLKYRNWFEPGDRFIVVGTGAADDMGVRYPWTAPYDLYKWCRAAKHNGAEVIFLSVGVGPILNPVSRALMLRALRLADYRSYREQGSFDYLRSVGFDTTGDLLYPDLAFGLHLDHAPLPRRRSGPPKVVGLGLMTYRGWRHDPRNGEALYQRYVMQMQSFVAWLLRRGITVRVVIGDRADSETVDDIRRHFQVRDASAASELLVVEPVDTVDDLLAQIAQVDLMVASRFHNVLSALLMGVPVISLGYHVKHVNLMTGMGLGDYCQPIEQFTVEKLVEQFESYEARGAQLVDGILEKREQYRRLLDEQYRHVLRPEEHRRIEGALGERSRSEPSAPQSRSGLS